MGRAGPGEVSVGLCHRFRRRIPVTRAGQIRQLFGILEGALVSEILRSHATNSLGGERSETGGSREGI